MSYAFNNPPKIAPTELEPGHGLMPKRQKRVACTRPVCQGQPRCETCCAADAARGVRVGAPSVPPSEKT